MRKYNFFDNTICFIGIGWFVAFIIFLCTDNSTILSFSTLMNIIALTILTAFILVFFAYTIRKNYIAEAKEKYGAQLNKDFELNSINIVVSSDGSESHVLTYAEENKNLPKLFIAEQIK